MGIEPTSSAWKAEVLPLNDYPIWCRHLDSNGEPIAYRAIALPLCYAGIYDSVSAISAPSTLGQ